MEGFQKTRESTILADAFMRGIIRKGTPARAKIKVENASGSSFTVETGRLILDTNGRLWQIVTPAIVPSGDSAFVEAVQQTVDSFTHTVSDSYPFYAIEIPKAEDDSYLSGISVKDADGNVYEYKDHYVNIGANEKIFHVEADERQNVYVRLGFDNVVGYQPSNGETLEISVYRTFGKITVEQGSPFSFEYTQTIEESSISLSMSEMLIEGQDPISITTLRDLARYPSIYDNNAVFLGEFDFLIRRNYPTLQFLSVWNESAEEQARGANLDNINTLFVACLSEEGGEIIIDADEETEPRRLDEEELTDTQKAIRNTVHKADDSYKVCFVTPIIKRVQIHIYARVSSSYVASEIKEKIIEAILAEYGKETSNARRGQMKVLYRRVYDLLKQKISALSDGEADLQVAITDAASTRVKPELWRYADESSLSVEVETANLLTPSWGV